MPVINRLPIGGGASSGGTAGLNIFTQPNEPEKKDGIWIKTNNQYEKCIVDNHHLMSQTGVWSDVIKDIPANSNDTIFDAFLYNGNIALLHGQYIGDGRYSGYRIILFNGTSYSYINLNIGHYVHGIKCAVYNNKIYIFGYSEQDYSPNGINSRLYIYDGSTTTTVTLTNEVSSDASVVVYNNKIHTIGIRHYSYDENVWTELTPCPHYYFTEAIVFDGAIHVVSYNVNTSKGSPHYKYSGSSWTELSDAPVNFWYGTTVIYNGELHILSDSYHYKYNGNTWTQVSIPPLNAVSKAVTYNNSIYIFNADGRASFTTPARVYNPNTVILQRGDQHDGIYNTAIASTSITGDNSRFVSGFDDCYYFADSAFDWNAPMYYGNGSQWIKFKN